MDIFLSAQSKNPCAEREYNPNKGKMYHADQRCAAVAKRFLPLTPITYAELNTTYSYLTPCSKCANLLYTKAMIDEINIENGYQP